MDFIPNTDQDHETMLRAMGVESFEDLVRDVPEKLREKAGLNLPPPLSEMELIREFRFLAERNRTPAREVSFLGAGAYRHFVPSAVSYLVSRSEFATCYTPYQPEVSQGTLQAIYEFQTFICELTGMDVANASMYDGATALAEAVLLALRGTGRKKILCSDLVHPHYRDVVRTYLNPLEVELELTDDVSDGVTNPARFRGKMDSDTACLIVQNPNFLGHVEDVAPVSDLAKQNESLLIQVTAEPLSLPLLRTSGEAGVDIFVGEGQSFGLPVSFGGPFLGLFAVREEWVRRLPGRLAGRTVGRNGETGYVLTLSTREQHIRRDKATSNICTNQALCALTASVYLALMGPTGLKELAALNWNKTEYAKRLFGSIPGFSTPYPHPGFNEFVLEVPVGPSAIRQRMKEEHIIPGWDLSRYYPDLRNHMLFCVTELISKQDMDRTAEILREFSKT
jgi:glycine dehydrogenase subunit 1